MALLMGGRSAGLAGQGIVSRGEPVPEVVSQALLAQVRGWGGCRSLAEVTRGESAFFGTVHLFVGRCEAEHGRRLRPVAAFDQAGVAYLLDSPSAFNFLLARHPPVVPSDSNIIRYASEALSMMGEIPWQATIVSEGADLPVQVRSTLGLPFPESRILQQSSSYAQLSLVFLTDLELRRVGVTISSSGHVVIFQRESLWSR